GEPVGGGGGEPVGGGGGEPVGCGDIDYLGTCEGDIAVWCQDDTLQRFDCTTEGGAECGWVDNETGYWCIAPPVDPSQLTIGGPCDANTGCQGGACLTDGFPGGYCVLFGCDAESCPADAACFIIDEEENTACLPTCVNDAGCGRVGYVCDESICLPGEGEPVDPPIGAGRVTGALQYEQRWGQLDAQNNVFIAAPSRSGAAGVYVAIYDANGEGIGEGLTGDDGVFDVAVSSPLTGQEALVFATIWWDADSSSIPLAVTRPPINPAQLPGVAEPDTFDSQVWAWQADVPANGRVGEFTVTEAEGAGALFVYEFNYSAMNTILSDALGGDVSRLSSLGVLWTADLGWSCGACFWGVPQIVNGIELSNSIFIGGERDGSSAWGWPVLLHEFGHYVANRYARDDSPGGAHYVSEPVAPAFAFSEGWATFFALQTVSRWIDAPVTVFWDIQQGYSFWTDYTSTQRSDGGFVTYPDPQGSQQQDLDEQYVTAVLWHLWDGGDVPESSDEGDGVAVTTPQVMRAITSPRFRGSDRAASGADLVDFIDALECQNQGIAEDIDNYLWGYIGFPYDGRAACN
ncbi:hypothetical protein KJ940_03360, partial [Myxococcota bacterium]|nr:hypothetical protein [Myxococcota bacterium]